MVQDRLNLINQRYKLNTETLELMQKIRDIVHAAADEVDKAVASMPHDVGRRIAAIDALYSAKDIAIASLLLAPGFREYQLANAAPS